MSRAASLALMAVLLATLAVAQTSQQPASSDQATDPGQTTVYDENQDTQQGSQAPVTPEPLSQQPQNQPAGAQPSVQSRPATAGAATGREVAAGTEIRAALDKRLSSRTSDAGEKFTATVSEPVRAANGDVVIPAGAKIHGEVTNVEEGKTLPAVRGKGQLNLRFRSISLPGGSSVPITATLKSVHETSGEKMGKAKTGEEGEVESRTSGTEAAKNVGIGAAIGTVAGLIFGSPLKGLAIGAIAGGGYVLATKGKDVDLPEDTGLRLQLDRNLVVPATTSRP